MRRDSEVDVKKMAFVLFFFFMSDKILFVQFFDIVLWRDTVSLMRQIFFLTRCLSFQRFFCKYQLRLYFSISYSNLYAMALTVLYSTGPH